MLTDHPLKRIRKDQARRLYNEGNLILALPHKFNPKNIFMGPGIVLDKERLGGRDFDKVVNEATYYNCCGEGGRYLAYYIED